MAMLIIDSVNFGGTRHTFKEQGIQRGKVASMYSRPQMISPGPLGMQAAFIAIKQSKNTSNSGIKTNMPT